MQNELDALDNNKTLELTLLHPDKHIIDCKWVYKVKYNPHGSIQGFKTRLVARGDK